MPITPQWGGRPQQQQSSPPVRISRRPKKRTHPDVPEGSGLDGPPVQSAAPPQLDARAQARNESFGNTTDSAPMPGEFTADLPDPPVVGLNTGHARRDIQLPAPTYPQSVPVSSQIEGAPRPQFDSQYQPTPQEQAATQAQASARASESPTDKMVRESGERLAAANAEQPTKRHGVGGHILSGLESFVIGAGRPFQQHMPQNSRELAYGLSQGAATGAYGAVNSDYPSRVRIEGKRKLYGEEYDTAVQRQRAETQNSELRNKGVRESRKIELKGLLDNAKLRIQTRGLDLREQNNLAIQQLRKEGVINDQEELELRRTISTQQNDDRDADRAQRDRFETGRNERWKTKLDQDARFKEANLKVAQRRAAAYEKAVEKGGGSAEVKKATAAAEADAWDESAAEIESDIYQFDKENPEDERGSQYRVGKANLERQLRDARLKGDRARATAGVQTQAAVTKDELKAIPDENAVREWAQSHGRKPDAAVLLWKQLRGPK